MANLLALVIVFAILVGPLGIMVDGLGVNWGTISTHKLPPKTVVQMLKDNNIKKVKLFDVDETIMGAVAGSGLEVMVAVPNYMLEVMGSYDRAKDWVRKNVTRYYNYNGGVNVTFVAVGNEPFHKAYNGAYIDLTFPALQNIQNALNEAGLGNSVKATVPFSTDVYDSPASNNMPSAGRFRPDFIGQMTQIVDFLGKNNAPITINIYPFSSLYGDDYFPLNYAFFDGAQPVDDNGIAYTNVFDASFDTFVSSLKAVGHGDMPIIVGEIGWPTKGGKHANISNAYRFYNGLLPRLGTNKGTPLRPTYIEVYLFGLLDEDAKCIAPGDIECHWGIFRFDGQPKFPIDLSGQGQNKLLIGAKNVKYLPNKWCMFNPKAKDLTKLAENINLACKYSDCTELGYGSSCNSLDANGNASYAFNMYFQMKNQDENACIFQGLAKITTKNISQGQCNFPIQIVASSASLSSYSFSSLVLLIFGVWFLLSRVMF